MSWILIKNAFLDLKLKILAHRPVVSSFGERRKWPKFSKAPAPASAHQLVLLILFLSFALSSCFELPS